MLGPRVGLRAAIVAAMLACAAAPTRVCSAQSDANRSQISQFVDNVAQQVYFFAFPSATYKSVKLSGITPIAGGLSVRITLFGLSAFDGSDLWTEVIMTIQDGAISDLRFGASNAILMRPGETAREVGRLLVSLNQQYRPAATSTSVVRQLPMRAVCVFNPSRSKVTFNLSWNGSVGAHTLEPGASLIFRNRGDAADVWVAFDSDATSGSHARAVRITTDANESPINTCDDFVRYDFQQANDVMGFGPARWIPGSEHPFRSDVFAKSEPNSWVCRPGYKWLAPDDTNSLDCIPAETGLVGVIFQIDSVAMIPLITRVVAGGAADRAGVSPGSYILSVDNRPMERASRDTVTGALRGPIGGDVRLVLRESSGQVRTVVLTRR